MRCRQLRPLNPIVAAGLLAAGPACKQAAPRRARPGLRPSGPPRSGCSRSRGKDSEKLFIPGRIEARQKINIIPETGGKIARILVNEGDRVAKGQLLAELDTEAIVSS